jgi:hypothetical protein
MLLQCAEGYIIPDAGALVGGGSSLFVLDEQILMPNSSGFINSKKCLKTNVSTLAGTLQTALKFIGKIN